MQPAVAHDEPLAINYHPTTPQEKKLVFAALLFDRAGKAGGTPAAICERLGVSLGWYYATRRNDPDFKSDVDRILEQSRDIIAHEAEQILFGAMRGDYSDDGRPDIAVAWKILQHLNRQTYGQKVEHKHTGAIELTVPRRQRLNTIIEATAQPAPEPVWEGGPPEDPTIPFDDGEGEFFDEDE